MKTGMKGAKKLLLRSRKGPQTVKTGNPPSPPPTPGNTVNHNLSPTRTHSVHLYPQPQAHAGGGPLVGAVVRQADVLPGREELLPTVPPHGVQRGEHALLVGLRWVPERGEQEHRRGEGPGHLRGLHLHSVAEGGLTAPRFLTFRCASLNGGAFSEVCPTPLFPLPTALGEPGLPGAWDD